MSEAALWAALIAQIAWWFFAIPTRDPAWGTIHTCFFGICGNFCSNPFYVNFGETLNSGGVDFVYAQTCDAFGQIETED